MINTNDVTENFGPLYHPKSALVFYQTKDLNAAGYVEHFDMDKNGTPINAHPLTEMEAKALAKALNIDKEKSKAFLKPHGILPTQVLHIDPSTDGAVLWYTKVRRPKMFFIQSLEIPSGIAEVPAMLWYANKQRLMVFALTTNQRPTEKTALYHAPFFNIDESGSVCMGTVDVNIKNSASVEEFMQAWESYFFNSYFSHLMNEHNPVKGNCISLWKDLVETGKPFPKQVLKKNNKTTKNLLR